VTTSEGKITNLEVLNDEGPISGTPAILDLFTSRITSDTSCTYRIAVVPSCSRRSSNTRVLWQALDEGVRSYILIQLIYYYELRAGTFVEDECDDRGGDDDVQGVRVRAFFRRVRDMLADIITGPVAYHQHTHWRETAWLHEVAGSCDVVLRHSNSSYGRLYDRSAFGGPHLGWGAPRQSSDMRRMCTVAVLPHAMDPEEFPDPYRLFGDDADTMHIGIVLFRTPLAAYLEHIQEGVWRAICCSTPRENWWRAYCSQVTGAEEAEDVSQPGEDAADSRYSLAQRRLSKKQRLIADRTVGEMVEKYSSSPSHGRDITMMGMQHHGHLSDHTYQGSLSYVVTPVSPVPEEFASMFNCPASPLEGYSVDEFDSIVRSVFQPALTRAMQQGFSSPRLLTEPPALEFEALMDMDYGRWCQAQCWEEYSKLLALAVFGDFCRIRACSCVVNMPFFERTLQYAVSESVIHPRRGDARYAPATHTPLYQDGQTLVGMVRLVPRKPGLLPDRRNEIVCVSS